MPIKSWQVASFLALSLTCQLYGAEPGRYAKQLRSECDALMQAATRRPYGWGWDIISSTNPSGKNAPRHVTMQPLGTPSAGILLLWSGQLLDEAKYKQAAKEAARGITAAQTNTGMIPQNAIFGANANGRVEPRVVPDRSATCASLALLLSVIDAEDSKPEILSRTAHRAAYWLITQQADDGGWPSAYPDDATQSEAVRIIRLDNPDYRNSTFAMLLASEILGDELLTKDADKSISKLLALRQIDQPTTQPTTEPAVVESTQLWSTAYQPSGAIDPSLKQFPAGSDVVASRFAMQTLLGSYFITGEKQSGIALDIATSALSDLQRPDGTWQRVYLAHPTTAPTTTQESAGTFDPPPENEAPWKTGKFDLDPTLDAVKQLKVLGREKYQMMLAKQFATHQQLAAAICGLSDDPLTLDLPVSATEVDAYLQKHADDFAQLDSALPTDLPSRLKRLWLLLIRAKIEQMQS